MHPKHGLSDTPCALVGLRFAPNGGTTQFVINENSKMINYRIRSIRMLFVILMTLAAGAQMAHAAKGGRSDFYQKYMSRPSEELIRIGKDYRLRKNKPDSALLFSSALMLGV